MWELVLSGKNCIAIDVRSQKWWNDMEVRTAFQERKDKMLNKLEMSAAELVNWKYITKGQRDHEKRTKVPQGVIPMEYMIHVKEGWEILDDRLMDVLEEVGRIAMGGVTYRQRSPQVIEVEFVTLKRQVSAVGAIEGLLQDKGLDRVEPMMTIQRAEERRDGRREPSDECCELSVRTMGTVRQVDMEVVVRLNGVIANVRMYLPNNTTNIIFYVGTQGKSDVRKVIESLRAMALNRYTDTDTLW
jgi:hypothetical protein